MSRKWLYIMSNDVQTLGAEGTGLKVKTCVCCAHTRQLTDILFSDWLQVRHCMAAGISENWNRKEHRHNETEGGVALQWRVWQLYTELWRRC